MANQDSFKSKFGWVLAMDIMLLVFVVIVGIGYASHWQGFSTDVAPVPASE